MKTLSDKINKEDCFYLKDVREFIKDDGDIIQEFIEGKISCARMWIKREELAGEHLI